MIVVDLPLRTGRGLNDRTHWSKRARINKRHRGTACLFVRSAIRTAHMTLPATVHLVRLSSMFLDDDNLQGALKSIRDGVADAFGVDDGRKSPLTFTYAQAKCKRGAHGVRIEIQAAGAQGASDAAAAATTGRNGDGLHDRV